jgi:hypothetical protein
MDQGLDGWREKRAKCYCDLMNMFYAWLVLLSCLAMPPRVARQTSWLIQERELLGCNQTMLLNLWVPPRILTSADLTAFMYTIVA